MPRFFRIFLYLSIFSIAGFFVVKSQLKRYEKPMVIEKSGYGHAEIGGPFSLIDKHGKIRTNTEFKGKYMLVYFGYSYCPDVCPLGLFNITQALKMMQRDRDQIVPIFITVDPKRDTQEQLKLYAQNFDPNFVMLTGPEKDVRSAMKYYKAYAAKREEGDMDDYLVDHSTLIYLMDRDGYFIQSFPHVIDPELLSKGLVSMLSKEIKAKSRNP